ncbi:hypothetical protein D3C79_617570 [compost metagenome]
MVRAGVLGEQVIKPRTAKLVQIVVPRVSGRLLQCLRAGSYHSLVIGAGIFHIALFHPPNDLGPDVIVELSWRPQACGPVTEGVAWLGHTDSDGLFQQLGHLALDIGVVERQCREDRNERHQG